MLQFSAVCAFTIAFFLSFRTSLQYDYKPGATCRFGLLFLSLICISFMRDDLLCDTACHESINLGHTEYGSVDFQYVIVKLYLA